MQLVMQARHPRANRVSHRIRMQLRRCLIAAQLISLGNVTGSEVLSALGNVLGERGVHPKAESFSKERDSPQFGRDMVSHLFLLVTMLSLHCCPTASSWILFK